MVGGGGEMEGEYTTSGASEGGRGALARGHCFWVTSCTCSGSPTTEPRSAKKNKDGK